MEAADLRLFWAIEIDREARDRIGEWCRRVTPRLRGWRVLDPRGLHLTLRFLGRAAATLVPELLEGARRALAGLDPWRIGLGGWAVLPTAHRPRVLVLELSEGADQAAEIAGRLETLAVRLGFPAERRPFRAHLTVARGRRGQRPRVPEDLVPPPPVAFFARDITLFRSHLEPAGARYESLGAVSLGSK